MERSHTVTETLHGQVETREYKQFPVSKYLPTLDEWILAAYPATPAVEKMAAAERIVSTIASGADINETPRVDIAVQEVYRALDERRAQRDTRFSGIPTGFAELDTLTAGLRRSEFTVLAARPSVGKTALAANIAVHVAVHERTPVLFVSLEQKRTELAERILAGMACVDLRRLRSGRLREAEAERVMKAGETLSRSPLFVDDNETQSVVQIAANVRRMKRRHSIGFVVIDYLQLAQPDGRRDNRQEQVAAMSRRLKLLARELDIPVLCLAQLNREV